MAQQLSSSQVETYARQAGFSGPALRLIMAIAWIESRWEPEPPNSPPTGTGILQINLEAWSAHGATRECALDPACAFRFAHDVIVPLQGWKAWGPDLQQARSIGSTIKLSDGGTTPWVPGSNPQTWPVVGGAATAGGAVGSVLGAIGHWDDTLSQSINNIPSDITHALIIDPVVGTAKSIMLAAMPWVLIVIAIVVFGKAFVGSIGGSSNTTVTVQDSRGKSKS